MSPLSEAAAVSLESSESTSLEYPHRPMGHGGVKQGQAPL